jgi:hypothetical protein
MHLHCTSSVFKATWAASASMTPSSSARLDQSSRGHPRADSPKGAVRAVPCSTANRDILPVAFNPNSGPTGTTSPPIGSALPLFASGKRSERPAYGVARPDRSEYIRR